MDNSIPLPVQILAPWLEDNALFVTEFVERDKELTTKARGIREDLGAKGEIKLAPSVAPCALAAVDAASIMQSAGDDQLSLLFQTVTYNSDDTFTLSAPHRISGLNGYDLRQLYSPMRLAYELEALAQISKPTIADNSYFAMMMEVNHVIYSVETQSNPLLETLANMLVQEGRFIDMVGNKNIIAMSKIAQSDRYIRGISDRWTLGRVLEAGEYLAPQRLIDVATAERKAKIRLTTKRFTSSERERIETVYEKELSVVYFKPHPWSRAFRIEGHRTMLYDDQFLFPLLAAVTQQTAVNRMVMEPYPQFMADYTAKVISAVGALYGDANWHRVPVLNDLWPRT